jgi:hypothetical protein
MTATAADDKPSSEAPTQRAQTKNAAALQCDNRFLKFSLAVYAATGRCGQSHCRLRYRHISVRARVVRARAEPTEAELRKLLSSRLCRCSAYVPILAAALDAAKRLRETCADA